MYDHILARLEQSQSYDSKGMNCIGFTYFLLGMDPVERFRHVGYLVDTDSRLRIVDHIEQANAVGVQPNPDYYVESKSGCILHLATIHPKSKNLIIERKGINMPPRIVSIDSILHDKSQKIKPVLLHFER